MVISIVSSVRCETTLISTGAIVVSLGEIDRIEVLFERYDPASFRSRRRFRNSESRWWRGKAGHLTTSKRTAPVPSFG